MTDFLIAGQGVDGRAAEALQRLKDTQNFDKELGDGKVDSVDEANELLDGLHYTGYDGKAVNTSNGILDPHDIDQREYDKNKRARFEEDIVALHSEFKKRFSSDSSKLVPISYFVTNKPTPADKNEPASQTVNDLDKIVSNPDSLKQFSDTSLKGLYDAYDHVVTARKITEQPNAISSAEQQLKTFDPKLKTLVEGEVLRRTMSTEEGKNLIEGSTKLFSGAAVSIKALQSGSDGENFSNVTLTIKTADGKVIDGIVPYEVHDNTGSYAIAYEGKEYLVPNDIVSYCESKIYSVFDDEKKAGFRGDTGSVFSYKMPKYAHKFGQYSNSDFSMHILRSF